MYNSLNFFFLVSIILFMHLSINVKIMPLCLFTTVKVTPLCWSSLPKTVAVRRNHVGISDYIFAKLPYLISQYLLISLP